MTDVEKVALWAGLISSIVSIVLSIVAIITATLASKRSEKVSDQTIRSLQKIESDVARLSDDTSGLIKAAWEKMLGSFSGTGPKDAVTAAAAEEMAAGLSEELRSELPLPQKPPDKSADPNVVELARKIDAAFEKLENTIKSQLKAQGRQPREAAVFNKVGVLEKLSDQAQELASRIRNLHLTRDQYKSLEKGPIADAIRELRGAGVLAPLSGIDGNQEKLVYWFPPNHYKSLRSALLLLPPRPAAAKDSVGAELKRIKYRPELTDE